MDNSQENYQLQKQPIKLTINIILLTFFTIFIYLIHYDNIGFSFDKILHQEYRIFTSLFFTENLFHLIEILFLIIIFSLCREAQKGSLAFGLDIIIKQFLLIALGLLVYYILFLCSKIFKSIFLEVFENQKVKQTNTLEFIILTEITVFLFSKKCSKNNTIFTSNPLLFWIPFCYLIIQNYQNLLMYISLVLSVLEITGVLVFYENIQNSNFNSNFENFLKSFQKFLYFYYPPQTYSNAPSNQMIKEDQETTQITNEQKNKYDEIKIDDFIPRKNKSMMVGDDSYEIQ